jgi:outer membrane protein assembly factor BamB
MRRVPILCILICSCAATFTLAFAAKKGGDGSHWPSFRGRDAAGVADGQNLPETWSAESGAGIRWKVRIPGLAHSSPVVWGDRVFVTTAVSSAGNHSFRRGLYGAGDASDDRSSHQWKVYAIDKRTGKVIWERVAYEGAPKEKRHIKSTYASSTPATNGRYVVAFFGSQGLFAYDVHGKLAWKADLGRLDVGAYNDPSYEWGTASSPIIWKDLVIVQCDTSRDDFLAAFHLKTGREVWRTPREEFPSWGTPTVYPGRAHGKGRPELVTNASRFIRGYDPATGRELWRLGGSSDITAPTPIFDGDYIVVASGRRPVAPIFVLKAGASGEITLPAGKSSSEFVAWNRNQRGSYMPTPLIYQGYLYVLGNAGVFDCYELATGKEVYRQRIAHQGSGFSGSPVAADGKIYLPSEDGDIFIVRAGPQFAVLGTAKMGEPLMATPALSDGAMFIRAQEHLYAVGK